MRKLSLNTFSSAMKWHHSYLISCLALLPVVVFFSFCKPWEIGYDFWETAATVREVSARPLQPLNPIYFLPGETSPRFVPYTIFWGFFKRISNLGIFTTMAIAGLVNYAIFMFGLYRFVSKQFKSDSLPTYALISMLCVWGTGYAWANAYHFEMFCLGLPYVGFFSFALSLNALYYLNCYCENSRWSHLLLYSILSLISFVSHPISGLFCFAAALAMLLVYKDFRRIVFLQTIPLLAFGVCLIWPYFSYWDVFTKGTTQDWFRSSLFSNRIVALGSAVVGLPIVVLYSLRKECLFLLYGLVFCSFIYVISGFLRILAGGRFILFSTFFLHLAIALYIKQNDIFNLNKIRTSVRSDGLIVVLVFALFIPSGMYRIKEIGKHLGRIFDRPLEIHNYDSPAGPYLFLSEHLSNSNVVLANSHEAGVIPAITGARVVAAQRSNPLIVDETNQRAEDVSKFFTSQVSIRERIELISRYHVTHIMINLENEKNWAATLKKDVEAIGIEEAKENAIILYRVPKAIDSIGTYQQKLF